MNAHHLLPQNNRARTPTTRLLLTLAGLVSILLIAGCQSVGGPAGFASVTIAGHSDEQIRQTTVYVFREKGFSGSGGTLVFERAGTTANTLAYDGFAAAQSGATSVVRVRAEVVDLGPNSRRLQCQAYIVSGADDAFFEEEHRLSKIRSGPYRKMLNEVAKRLNQK